MDEQLHRMNSQTFTATDEAETVEVTLNGHHHLTGAFIEDGLFPAGRETVERRLNEALQKATAAATDVDRGRQGAHRRGGHGNHRRLAGRRFLLMANLAISTDPFRMMFADIYRESLWPVIVPVELRGNR